MGYFLTHLCQMDFPISINRTSSFPILGLLGCIFRFHSNFKRTFCMQTVESLIRRLIGVFAVCLCPTKRTLGLYGLIDISMKIYSIPMHESVRMDPDQTRHDNRT